MGTSGRTPQRGDVWRLLANQHSFVVLETKNDGVVLKNITHRSGAERTVSLAKLRADYVFVSVSGVST